MRFSMAKIMVFLACLSSVASYAHDTAAEAFPREVSFEANGKQYDLMETGAATRKKLIIKVYTIAHYLQKNIEQSKADKLQEIFSDNYAKQFTIKWLRDIDGDKVREVFQESFHRVLPGQSYSQLDGEINNFLQFFSKGVHKGDTTVIRWAPGGYVEVLLNGTKLGSLSNVNFAKAVWTIWLGPNSVVNRNELISQMH